MSALSSFQSRIGMSRALMATALCFTLLGFESSLEANEGKRTISAERAVTSPLIDGLIDDPVWALAESGGDFTQKDPDEGKPASLATTFRVAYDKGNLYIAGHLTDDAPDKIVNRLTRRDRDSESDWFGIVIDSYHDSKSGRYFMVNAAGVQRDGSISNDSNMDDSWDGVWESAVNIGKDGWDIEVRIPFSMLRFANLDEATWGFNTFRYISRKKEEDFWCPITRSSSRLVSLSGHLTGISTVQAPRRLSITPYQSTTAQLNTDQENVTNQGLLSASGSSSEDFKYGVGASVGLDAEYGLTTDMTLDLTINPDFGQVEVDQSVVNLTAFETFFPEKRPFFLEGADIFSTVGTFGDDPSNGTRIFYSRHIGGQPLGYDDVSAPEGGAILENPSHTPILSAVKLTGRNSHGLSVGFLEAVTGPTFARVQDAGGAIHDLETSPLTNYAVARVRQEIGAQSYVGGTVTAVNRGTDQPDAYVAAADSILRTSDGSYSLSTLAGVSTRREGESSEVGGVGQILASREAGKRMVGLLGYYFATPGFNVNDLGYMQRVDEHGGLAWVQLRNNEGFGPFRQARMNFNGWSSFLMREGLRAGVGGNVNVNLNFRNYWFMYAGVGGNASGYDAYEARVDDRVYLKPASIFGFGGLNSDSRKPVSVGLGVNVSRDASSAVDLSLSPSVEMKVGSRGEISVGSTLSRSMHQLAWAATLENQQTVAEEEPLPIFGRRDLQQADVWVRGTVTFTERLSVQFFSQLLTAQGVYSDYQKLLSDGTLGPLGFTFDPSSALYSDYDPNFTTRLFNANVILRWEFRPGSTLYGVWTQARSMGDSAVALAPVVNPLHTFSNGSENALMLKLSYRWGT